MKPHLTTVVAFFKGKLIRSNTNHDFKVYMSFDDAKMSLKNEYDAIKSRLNQQDVTVTVDKKTVSSYELQTLNGNTIIGNIYSFE